MSHAATSQFFEGLRASRLLDDASVEELKSRPEATCGDVRFPFQLRTGARLVDRVSSARTARGTWSRACCVGGYRIFDKLDDGPGGVTFKALHPALQQPVSLRVLRPEWLGPADTSADYLARVHDACLAQSPHLAVVLDAGTHEDAPFIVQEYVGRLRSVPTCERDGRCSGRPGVRVRPPGRCRDPRLRTKRASCTETCRLSRYSSPP